ncbi:hypothetical protein HX001_04005 [Empedobacter brevis]|uniref:Lipoprotein n=1 Tax=Empedobacter brevis TaxID=247 RepID=A0AAJ1QCT7_9FLAO|nr:hypothetical protein [Empedobacter brevis]MDM1071655.1 hypothetical protein [Empedobacter brevis]QHC85821.1 hypothetical protein AS589_14030 [Empedobacter brevis]
MKILFFVSFIVFSSCFSKGDYKYQENSAIKEIEVVYNRGIYSYYLMEGKLIVKNYESISNNYFEISKKGKAELTSLYYENKLNEEPKKVEIVVDESTYLNMPATEIDYYISFENGTIQHFYLKRDHEKTPLDYFKYRKYKNFITEIDQIIDSLKKKYHFNKSDIIRM